MDLSGVGKLIMIAGLLLALFGLFLWLGGKIPFLGRLPGDILIKKGNFSFYFPIVTCILLSIILSILLALFQRK